MCAGAQARERTCARADTHTHLHMHMRTHAHTHTHACMQTCPYIHECIHTFVPAYGGADVHIYIESVSEE
jgi:hypothetical protein